MSASVKFKTKFRSQPVSAGIACALILVLGRVSMLRADGPDQLPPVPSAVAPATRPSIDAAAPPDLRTLIGVNPLGITKVQLPHMPTMTLRGFISIDGQKPIALLELTELNRVFLVSEGSQIPVIVTGHVLPVGHNELSGLEGEKPVEAAPRPAETNEQTQIILSVTSVSRDGVTVEANILGQKLVIR